MYLSPLVQSVSLLKNLSMPVMIAPYCKERVGASGKKAFPFMGERCDRVVRCVMERLQA